MRKTILIVEDQFIEANDIRIILEKEGHKVCGIARSVDIAKTLVVQHNPDLVLLDIFLKGPLTGIDLALYLKEKDIPFIYLSANSNQDILLAAKQTQPEGFIVKPFRQKDLLVTLEVAFYRHENSMQSTFRKDALFRKQMNEIANEQTGWQEKLLKIGKAIQPYIPFDYFSAGFKTEQYPQQNIISFLRIGFNEYQVIGIQEMMTIANLSLNEMASLQQKTVFPLLPTLYNEQEFELLCAKQNMRRVIAHVFKVHTHITFPMSLSNGKTFHFNFFSKRTDVYSKAHFDVYSRLQGALSKTLEFMLENETSSIAADNVIQPAQEETKQEHGFSGIIGNSSSLLHILDQLKQVAPVDTSVLILGESGTGKERIADCIHQLSPRKKQPFIKLNCAALPSNLIESELFGHEKGAFTGAIDKRIGKFEKAHHGTLFLDEIGEMPLEMQVKLLRVLQEKEIERIGGRETIKTDVRIIAATNRNLEKEVAEGRFRLDLYYRLNIFPITLPPLRNRLDDLPLLVKHFLQYYNRKTGKRVMDISDKLMTQLLNYNWPGNIRELEHLIERSILLAKDDVIKEILLPATQAPYEQKEVHSNRIKSIEENERDHILHVLKKCKGKVWGEGGAAELLNVPPTTLSSKMKKLGIKRDFQ